jgi:hypothetical protein
VEVLVNEQRIDVQLENERTLGEVVQGIRNWLQDMNLYITDLQVDRASHHLDDEATWAARNISDVDQIEIVALPPWEVRLNGYRILHNYVATLADALENGELADARELLGEFPYVRRHLSDVVSDVFGRAEETTLDTVASAARDVVDNDPANVPDSEAVTSLRHITTILDSRIRELATPHQEARKTEQALRGTLTELEEVSILLQTGEEQRAMSLIVRFSELVERLLRVLGAVESRYGGDPAAGSTGASLRERTDTLRSNLEELIQAFGDKDTVLIGDLVEYDILPTVEELLTLVPKADSHEESQSR